VVQRCVSIVEIRHHAITTDRLAEVARYQAILV
jgi:hypothetical protein